MGAGVDFEPGRLFAGDFRIVRRLSSGGMGSVYVAEQLSTSKERALKLMRPELLASADLRKRFEQEAKIGARIESDHVVEVIGAGVDEASGTPWLAMELLSGEELSAFAERRGPLSPEAVGEIFEQLCHALAAAHELRIVHRDLKPENIFLTAARRRGAPFVLKVLDFGIAKTLADAKTKMTAAVGTPLWMAPEQTQLGASVSASADVWACGLIAFRLLTGKAYWLSAHHEDSSPFTLLREVAMDPLVPASERARALGGAEPPSGFDEWFARCVSREPTSRFADAATMFAALPPSMKRDDAAGTRPSVVEPRASRTSTSVSSPGPGHEGAEPSASTVLATPAISDQAERGATFVASDTPMGLSPMTPAPVDPPSAVGHAQDAPAKGPAMAVVGVLGAVVLVGLAGAALSNVFQTRKEKRPPAMVHAETGDKGASATPSGTAAPDAVAMGYLTVTCKPSCEVMRDADSLGAAPILKAPTPPGWHEITLSRPGVPAHTENVNVSIGETSIVHVDMPDVSPASPPGSSSTKAPAPLAPRTLQ